MFGNKINVYMDSIGQFITEYLVNFDFFIDTMKKNGFQLINPEILNPMYQQLFQKKYRILLLMK